MTEATHAIVAGAMRVNVAGAMSVNVAGAILANVVGEMIANVVGEMIVSVVGLIRAMILAQHHMTRVMKIVRTLTHATQTARVMIHVSILNAQTMMSAIVLEVQSSAIHCARTTTRTVTQYVRATTHVIQKRIVTIHAHVGMQIHVTAVRVIHANAVGATHASVAGATSVNVAGVTHAFVGAIAVEN